MQLYLVGEFKEAYWHLNMNKIKVYITFFRFFKNKIGTIINYRSI